MTDPKETVNEALKHLSGVCDGAHSQDGHGFNGLDTTFGKLWAAQLLMGAELSDETYRKANQMLQKYQGQLKSVGITLPPQSAFPEIDAPAKIVVDGAKIYIYWNGKPNTINLDKTRKLTGRYWESTLPGTPWSVPLTSADEVENAWNLDAKTVQNLRADVVAAKNGKSKPTFQSEKQSELTIKMIAQDGIIAVFITGGTRDEFISSKNLVAGLPERKWRSDLPGKPWHVAERFLVELSGFFPEAIMDKATQTKLETMRKLAGMSNAEKTSFRFDGLNGTPHPFQWAGIEFVTLANGRAVIADQMGLGKTIQAIGWLQYKPELRPAVIVCPAGLKENWRRELDKWLTTGENVTVLKGKKPTPLEADGIYIINYEILKSWIPVLAQIAPKCAIVDEAHYCKNDKTQRSQVVKALSGSVESFIALTGTPVTNRPRELFPLLNMVAASAWKDFFRYAKEYCDAWQDDMNHWHFDGASNLDKLHELIKPYVIRRTKAQVLKELPAKVRAIVPLEIDRKEYLEKIYEIADKIAGLTKARALVEIEELKQATVEAKLPGAIDWIENFLESGEKLVVFATHHTTINALMDKFGDLAVEFTGETSPKQKQEAVDRFQNDDTIRLFVGNIKAAGVGITLTAASDVAFLEYPWTPGDFEQAEDRCHRIGQPDSVTSWALVAQDTIDEDIISILSSKSSVVDAVVDGKESGELNILDTLIRKIARYAREQKLDSN